MGRSHTLQTNFTAGELSPLLRAREDVQKFFNGAETLENFFVKPQGGAWRRSGTQFISETKDTDIVGWNDSTAKVRLIEFEFSTTQAYVLELGNLYARIYKQDGIVTEAATTITDVSAVNPGVDDSPVVTTSAPHGYSDGDHVIITGIVGMVELNGRRFEVENKTATTFELKHEDISGYTAYTSGGSAEKVYEIVTPWATADLDDLYFAQSADVLYVAHPDYEPRKITRTGDTAWTVSTFDGQSGPYLDLNSTDTTMQLSSVTYEGTVTATGFTFSDPGDVDKYIEYTNGDGLWGLGKITSVDSSTTATVEPQPVFHGNIDDYNFVSTGNQTNTVEGPYTATFNTKDIGSFVRCLNPNGDYIWRYIKSPDNSDSSAANVGTAAAGSAYADGNTGESLAANYVADGTDSASISGITYTATLTASSATFEGSTDDVGRWVRLHLGGEVVDLEITGNSGSSTTVVQVATNEDTPIPRDINNTYTYANDAKTKFWRLGAWSEATGWPSVVSFHQQRLWFASTTNSPDTLWSSKVDDYDNFQPTDPDGTVLDDSAITVTIASNQVNAIKWIESGPVMLIGTLSGEYQMRAASTINEPLTPTNIDVKLQTSNGTKSSHMPQRVGSSVLFIQRSGRKLHDMRYSFEVDSFVSRDLTVTSEHILRDEGKGERMRFQKNPSTLLWVLTEGGNPACLTYDTEQDVYAWTMQLIGGSGVVESIASIPSSDATEDEVWMVVKRTINGQTVRYVEKLLPDFHPTSPTDKADMRFVDSMLSGSAASTTVYGLNHLEGESVQVVVDGDYVGDKTVSSGTITLADTGTTVIAGLQYISKVQTMPLAPRGDWGSSGGSVKKIPMGHIHVLNSLGHRYGTSENDLIQVDYRAEDDDTDQTPDLYTGWKEFNIYGDDDLDLDIDFEGQVWFQQQQPQPLNILSIVVVVENSE